MQNRKLIWIAIIAFGAAGVAAFLNSLARVDPPSVSVSKPQNLAVRSSVAKRHFGPARDDTASMVLNDPAAAAMEKIQGFLAEDPQDQDGRAFKVLTEFCQAGQFQIALQLANAVPADLRTDWVKFVFCNWTQHQPLEAMAILNSEVTDPPLREGIFQAMIGTWKSSDPAGLANYAETLPESEDRKFAMVQAISNWATQDPAAMAVWLNNIPRGDDYDYGVTTMLDRSDGANRSPQEAMQWVETISNPVSKRSSFQRVLAEWLQTDAVAARQYVASALWLDDTTRAKILTGL